MGKVYTSFQIKKSTKTIPFDTAHTYTAYMME